MGESVGTKKGEFALSQRCQRVERFQLGIYEPWVAHNEPPIGKARQKSGEYLTEPGPGGECVGAGERRVDRNTQTFCFTAEP